MKANLLDILKDNFQRKRSLVAFNVQNIYHLQAINEITEKLKVPIIVQFSARYVVQFEKRYGFELLKKKFKNDYMYFHLDHCQDISLIQFCIESGFDGVMYDGSATPLNENIKKTNEVINMARAYDCLVEGELGEIGGVEDGVGTEEISFADLSQVVTYVNETGVDLLALGIGNAHGFYATLEHIDTSILLKAKKAIDKEQLFVLHGGSGLPENMILDTIQNGVVKINFSTQIKQTTNESLEEYLAIGELFNEINFEKTLLKNLIVLFEQLLKKYTI